MTRPETAENASPSQRSRDRLTKLAEANGWTVKTSADRWLTRDAYGRWMAEREHPFGLVRLVASWRNGRFEEALVGISKSVSAAILSRLADVRTILTDPDSGFERRPTSNGRRWDG